MKTAFYILLISFVPFNGFATVTGKVNFFQGSVTSAKAQAAAEGKLYFLDFVANWCMPCRWMDQTTYTDPTLSAYIGENYIPVKVDIDDFDGFALKQQYNIKLLPTILVFNARGKLLGRFEESLAPGKMLQILKQYDKPENRTRVQGNSPTTVVSNPVVRPQGPPQTTQRISRPALGKTNTRPTTAGMPANTGKIIKQAASTPIASGEGLFRLSVRQEASQGFSVQIGAFAEYGNVLREVAKLEEKFNQPIIIHISRLNQKTVFKVLIGSFPTRDQAISYQKQLRENDQIGLVKDLSTMK